MSGGSHIFELVEPGLHRIDVIALGGLADRSGNLALSRRDLPTSLHGLLVAHLRQELHHFAVVDRRRVDIVKGGVHIARFDVHVLKHLLEAADGAGHAQTVHLFHAALEHGHALLDLRRDLLGSVRGLQLCGQSTHFDSEATKVDCLFAIANDVFGENLGVLHLVFVQSLVDKEKFSQMICEKFIEMRYLLA